MSKKQARIVETIIRYGVLATSILSFIIFVIIDLFFNRNFMEGSIEITLKLQKIGGLPLEYMSKILSYPLFYGVLSLVYFYPIFAHSYQELYYHCFLLFIAIALNTNLKIIFGRTRPFVIDSSIDKNGCNCGYGMPSGHAGISVVLYYIISKFCDSIFKSKNCFLNLEILNSIYPLFTYQDLKLSYLSIISTVICILLFIGVSLSRIALGKHSWNQVLVGSLLSMIIISFTTKKSFMKCLFWSSKN